MTNNTKLGYLVGLLAIWGLVTVFQWTEWSGTEDQGPHANLGPAGVTAPSPSDLKLDKQFPNARQSVKLSNPRNIFAPLGATSVPMANANRSGGQPEVPTQTSHNIPVTPPPGPSPAELAAQRARQELNQYRFLGFLTKGGESQAFLTNGQAIYIVKQGEMLEGRVQVHKIEPETVTLSTTVWETGNIIQAAIPLTPGTNG